MSAELKHIRPATARAMIARNVSLSLKEFAVGYGYSYPTAKLLSKEPGFPLLGSRIIPSDFDLWRLRRLGLQSAPGAPAHPRPPAADKSDALRVRHG